LSVDRKVPRPCDVLGRPTHHSAPDLSTQWDQRGASEPQVVTDWTYLWITEDGAHVRRPSCLRREVGRNDLLVKVRCHRARARLNVDGSAINGGDEAGRKARCGSMFETRTARTDQHDAAVKQSCEPGAASGRGRILLRNERTVSGVMSVSGAPGVLVWPADMAHERPCNQRAST
jgi:hypothetical protein